MLIASLVIDDAASVTVRTGYLDIDGVYVTPVTVAEAERLAEQTAKLAAQMREDIARKVTEPMFDGPLADVTESELRLLAGDR